MHGNLFFFVAWTSWQKGLPILLTLLGDSWGRLATYQQIQNEVYSTPSNIPFRASNLNLMIGSKYRVLPCQPLSHLGELFQGLDPVISIPMQEETLGGKWSKTDHEVVFKDVCLSPNPGWSNVPRRTVKETLVHQNLYINMWSMDTSWSEERLRREIRALFQDPLKEGNE